MTSRIAISTLRVMKSLKETSVTKVTNLVPQKGQSDYSHLTARKSRYQLVLLSCAVCGIEFCYAAETAFVSPTLLKIGVPVLYMTLIWCLSPLLGFFLVPILGSLSDRCGAKIGRRRPFILLLSAGIVFGLVLVPNGRSIGVLLGDQYKWHPVVAPPTTPPPIGNNTNQTIPSTAVSNTTVSPDVLKWVPKHIHPWSVLFTVIGVVMLDFSCDACQSPSRAYLLDVCVPEDHALGLSTFTVMAGLGGSIGYLIGGIPWHTIGASFSMGGQVSFVFTLVLVIYIICCSMTVTSFREIPLDQIGVGAETFQCNKKKVGKAKYRKFTNEDDDDDSSEGDAVESQEVGQTAEHLDEQITSPKTYGSTADSFGEKTDQYQSLPGSVDTKLPVSNGAVQIEADEYYKSGGNEPMPSEITLRMYMLSVIRMPKSMFFLCLTNLFSWMSLVCYSLYFTDFVGQAVFGGDPNAPSGTRLHELYNDGVRLGSLAMSLYSLSCAVYSFVVERLVKRFKAKPVYIVGQLVYTVGMILLGLWRSKVAVFLFSPTAGVMYSTLFTMPYLLVAHYHSNDTFEEAAESGQEEKERKQVRGLGTDVAVVSSMVFVAQFILSACMGGIVHAAGSTVAVVYAAAVLSFFGAISATQVLYLDL